MPALTSLRLPLPLDDKALTTTSWACVPRRRCPCRWRSPRRRCRSHASHDPGVLSVPEHAPARSLARCSLWPDHLGRQILMLDIDAVSTIPMRTPAAGRPRSTPPEHGCAGQGPLIGEVRVVGRAAGPIQRNCAPGAPRPATSAGSRDPRIPPCSIRLAYLCTRHTNWRAPLRTATWRGASPDPERRKSPPPFRPCRSRTCPASRSDLIVEHAIGP